MQRVGATKMLERYEHMVVGSIPGGNISHFRGIGDDCQDIEEDFRKWIDTSGVFEKLKKVASKTNFRCFLSPYSNNGNPALLLSEDLRTAVPCDAFQVGADGEGKEEEDIGCIYEGYPKLDHRSGSGSLIMTRSRSNSLYKSDANRKGFNSVARPIDWWRISGLNLGRSH